MSSSLRDENKSRPFDAYDGGAKVLGAIKEVLKCGGSVEVALEHGEAALRDLRPSVDQALRMRGED